MSDVTSVNSSESNNADYFLKTYTKTHKISGGTIYDTISDANSIIELSSQIFNSKGKKFFSKYADVIVGLFSGVASTSFIYIVIVVINVVKSNNKESIDATSLLIWLIVFALSLILTLVFAYFKGDLEKNFSEISDLAHNIRAYFNYTRYEIDKSNNKDKSK